MNARILAFVIPLLISLYGLFMPPIQYVAESLDPPSSMVISDKTIGPIHVLIDEEKTLGPTAPAIRSNYRLFFLLWLVLTLTMLLYPVELWLRQAIWNTVGIGVILGIMLIFPAPYGETLSDRSLLLKPFFAIPLAINMAIALALMLWMRFTDIAKLDIFFTGFFPWMMIFYPFFVAVTNAVVLRNLKIDPNLGPSFKWLLAQIAVFWVMWISTMYNRINDYELPVLFKRRLDDYDD